MTTKEKIIYALIAVGIFNIVAALCSKIIIDKTTERVIKRLQKNYSPSPYGPGLDVDKIDNEAVKTEPEAVIKTNWQQVWEKERFSPEPQHDRS
jgi:hypothetical protein